MRLGKLFAAANGRRLTVIASAMLVAAAINIVEFASIDAPLGKNRKALYSYESFDIMQLGLKSRHVRLSHNLFAFVGREAPGARLIVTTPRLGRTSWFRGRMLGIGLASRIDICAIDPDFAAQLDPAIELLATGTVSNRGRKARRPDLTWGVAAMSAKPKTLIQVETADFDVLILDADAYDVPVSACK